ncbi:MAG: hypothetical protein ACTSRG_20500, partial [Candidatus Helarchaeota archaeon]
MIDLIPYLKMIISEHYAIDKDIIPVVGRALGFYFQIPSIDKLYRAHLKFKAEFIQKSLENNAEFLIKEGIINLETIIGDSTVFRTRKDDP